MKIRQNFALGLLGLLFMVSSVEAQTSRRVPAGYVPEPISLTQRIKPITRTYPGVDVGTLGIQTGMTISQVEAIAAKRGLGKPDDHEFSLTMPLTEFLMHSGDGHLSVSSRNYLDEVLYGPAHLYDVYVGQHVGISNTVAVYFSSPASGNRSEDIQRDTWYPTDPKMDPFTVTALAANLRRKYGPPSFQLHTQNSSGWLLWWNFSKQTLVPCKDRSGTCYPDSSMLKYRMRNLSNYAADQSAQDMPDFYIFAWIRPTPMNSSGDRANYDTRKAIALYLSLGDIQFTKLDHDEAVKQVKMIGANEAAMAKELMAAEAKEKAAAIAAEKKQAVQRLVPKF